MTEDEDFAPATSRAPVIRFRRGEFAEVGRARTAARIDWSFDETTLEEAAALSDLRAEMDAALKDAVDKRIRAWERATLEMAFDAGIDVRTPWGSDIAYLAGMTWRSWMTRPLFDAKVGRFIAEAL